MCVVAHNTATTTTTTIINNIPILYLVLYYYSKCHKLYLYTINNVHYYTTLLENAYTERNVSNYLKRFTT